MIKWLFFDVGSTLIDEHLVYEERLRNIAEEAGIPFEVVMETAINFYRQNKKGDLETAKLYGVQQREWSSEKEILYSDTVHCLKELSSRYKIGIIANQEPGTCERLNQYGILKYIDLVIASAEEGIAKPDRRIFELALKRSECSAEQAVMIGDRIDNDILPAKKIGMKTIWIRQGFGKYWTIQDKKEEPDYIIDGLSELILLLEKCNICDMTDKNILLYD